MALNIWALSIVKALGLGYPAFQLVFLRASVGLLLMLPWIWAYRRAFIGLPDLHLHALRVGFSAIALTASFFAIARLPLALFTAISFTRPILTMLAAAWLLKEIITRDRWIAAAVGLIGVIIAVDLGGIAGGWGLAAQVLVVLAATGAVITTRRLVAAPTVVMMTFYTAGLTLIAVPFAVVAWVPVPPDQWPLLLSIGDICPIGAVLFLKGASLWPSGISVGFILRQSRVLDRGRIPCFRRNSAIRVLGWCRADYRGDQFYYGVAAVGYFQFVTCV